MQDRRQYPKTAEAIAEALRMKTAFGLDAARRFLWRNKVGQAIAVRALAGRDDPRQMPS